VPRKAIICLGLALGLGLGLQAQPAPTKSEKELQAPLVLEDGKPTVQGVPDQGPSAGRTFGSMVLVLGLAGGALWALRRWGFKRLPGTGGTRLQVEESLALGDRRFVSILRAENERFLIALAPGGITLLSRLEAPDQELDPAFAEALARHESPLPMNQPMPVKEMEALLRGDRP
jgi:flagellar biogenesis protein FliO